MNPTSLIWRVTTPAGHRQIDLIPAVIGRSVHVEVDRQRIPATLRKPTVKEPVTEGTFVIDGMSLTFVFIYDWVAMKTDLFAHGVSLRDGRDLAQVRASVPPVQRNPALEELLGVASWRLAPGWALALAFALYVIAALASRFLSEPILVARLCLYGLLALGVRAGWIALARMNRRHREAATGRPRRAGELLALGLAYAALLLILGVTGVGVVVLASWSNFH